MANFFPRWTNWLPIKLVVCGIVIVCGLTAATWYYGTPKYTKVGYQPIQPVPFPHDIHVTQLGIDCRYCHSFVEVAAHSNVPNTQTCMNCHTQVQKDNPKLEPVRESWKSGDPVEWVWIYRPCDRSTPIRPGRRSSSFRAPAQALGCPFAPGCGSSCRSGYWARSSAPPLPQSCDNTGNLFPVASREYRGERAPAGSVDNPLSYISASRNTMSPQSARRR